ncbi:MAG: acyl-CoA dehydrogenase family protein [Rhodospirillales bacterium]|nr:acyl-CoA dehydrogenase family protein [Rhodospirillales bacterium]
MDRIIEDALAAAHRYEAAARTRFSGLLLRDGRVDAATLEAAQSAAHGFAWLCTSVAGLEALAKWAGTLELHGLLDGHCRDIRHLGFAELLARLVHGLPLSQGETLRPTEMGLAAEAAQLATDPAVAPFLNDPELPARRARVADGIGEAIAPDADETDPALAEMKRQLRRFAADKIDPHAQRWHNEDALIPIAVVEDLAAMGVFGLTIPEENGGLGLGKIAMCATSEELSRAHLATGSLATRSEIAGELVRLGGTDAQRAHWLPRIADGTCLPTAVFTEPDTGSDLGSIRTRAVRDGDVWRITGAKTWITHAARADLMTVLARTDPASRDHRGLSMFLAPKPRGTPDDPFPVAGLSGSEIGTLGYRGMQEFELSFDGFAVPADGLLGGVAGEGFRQLMATFESARIQTAARAVGVAEAAALAATAYARQRRQFGKPILAFPRVHAKIASMAVETTIARCLTRAAARAKDSGRRCDVEAGMAKLFAARAAWAAADDCVQIHGGNGYALEYSASRLLADARILNIFEGAAEIQAQVIVRGLLERRN